MYNNEPACKDCPHADDYNYCITVCEKFRNIVDDNYVQEVMTENWDN